MKKTIFKNKINYVYILFLLFSLILVMLFLNKPALANNILLKNKSSQATQTEKTKDVKLLIDNKIVKFDADDQPATIINGRVLVPMRKTFEVLNLTVDWDNLQKTATGKNDNTTIILKLDEKIANVNGKNVELDVPGQLISARIMVPVRFIAESTGATVDWDETNLQVIINAADSNSNNNNNNNNNNNSEINQSTLNLFAKNLKTKVNINKKDIIMSDYALSYEASNDYIYMELFFDNMYEMAFVKGLGSQKPAINNWLKANCEMIQKEFNKSVLAYVSLNAISYTYPEEYAKNNLYANTIKKVGDIYYIDYPYVKMFFKDKNNVEISYAY